MRVIKFRGKRLYDGEWVYGNPLIVNTDKRKVAMIVTLHESYPDTLAKVTTSVYPETVGQFTGLHDKNGREIYEGDIISSEKHPHNKHLIFYNEKQGRFMAGLHGNTDISAFGVCGIDDTTWMATKEIVGNVYDNHKLLKDENN